MANSWLRLWHDMPNDPKWKTIARISGQPVSLVLATYIHLLVDGSRNVTRGHSDVTAEDLASALDVTDEQIHAVLSAMEGRVIDDGFLTGWEKRQPKREDSAEEDGGAKGSAQRKREQRERERLAKLAAENAPPESESQQCHDESRNVTLDKDKDKDKEEKKETGAVKPRAPRPKKSEVTLRQYIDACREAGVKAVPDDHFIRTFAEDAGITNEMLQVAWAVFRDDHLSRGASAKKYTDWALTFSNAVKNGYLKIWFTEPTGEVKWTSVGLTRKNALEARIAL